jgi:hypothetical protein
MPGGDQFAINRLPVIPYPAPDIAINTFIVEKSRR